MLRARAAQLLWWGCAACALVLAFSALLVALRADPTISWVSWALDAGDAVGLGAFGPRDGWIRFGGEWGAVKSALVGCGLGAAAWLLAGGILGSAVRPR